MAEVEKSFGDLFEKVLVIDDDTLCLKLTVSQLKSLGAVAIDTAEDAEEGLKLAQQATYSLILQDWKLPTLSGLALYNRLRNHPAYQRTPILVVSGFVNKNDFRLLQEFPCTGLAEKPFTQKIIRDRLMKLADEVTWYKHHRAVVDEVFATIDHDPSKLSQVIFGVIKKSPNPAPLVLIAVRSLINHGAYKTAQAILEALLRLDSDSIIVLNELGKVLMHRGKHQEALKVLTKAHDFSSENVSRLCLIGEAKLNLLDYETARDCFTQALTIDPGYKMAIDGYRVAHNMVEHKNEVGNIGLSFASVLNTVGITMIRNGNFQKGVEQYQSALTFLQKPVDNAKIAFNLGLGYLKWGKADSALSWFRKSQSLGLGDFEKSQSYVRMLEKAKMSLKSGGVSDTSLDGLELPMEAELTEAAIEVKEAKIELDLMTDKKTQSPSQESVSGPGGGSKQSEPAETLVEPDKNLEDLSDKIAMSL